MKRLCVLLLCCSSAWAEPPSIEIPPEVRPSGQYATLIPKTDAVTIIYVGLDGIDSVPSQFLSDKRAFLLDCYGKPKGRYRFVAVGAGKTGEQTRVDFVVVVDNAPPSPVPPTPVPPAPTPEPSDPLWQPLKAAFQSDPSVMKAKDLAQIYRLASETTLYDKAVTTDAHLLSIMSSAADKAIGKAPSFEAVRRVLADESNKVMKPTNVSALDDARRDAWLKLFVRYALLLEQLK